MFRALITLTPITFEDLLPSPDLNPNVVLANIMTVEVPNSMHTTYNKNSFIYFT